MEFFKVNLDFVKNMQNMTKSEIVVLFHLALSMSFKNNLLWEKELQEIISFNLKIERHNLQNIVSRLVKKGYIIREGFYIRINEVYLKKGR